mgnify:CR=1 FL=1
MAHTNTKSAKKAVKSTTPRHSVILDEPTEIQREAVQKFHGRKFNNLVRWLIVQEHGRIFPGAVKVA